MKTTARRCTHSHSSVIHTAGYAGSVASHPYTSENRRAHGGVRFTYECADCGAQRRVNVNGVAEEYSSWGMSASERAKRAAAADRSRLAELADADASAANACGVKILRVGIGAVTVSVRGVEKTLDFDAIKEAAAQWDNGDFLVPIYRHLLRQQQSA